MRKLVYRSAVLLVVAAVSRAQTPVALDDTVRTNPGTAIEIDVLANDSDPQGDIDSASVTIVTPPTLGNAQSGSLPGWILYTPSPGQRGRDSLQYTVSDTSSNVSNAATVRILINFAPFGSDGFLTTPVNTPLVVLVTDYVFDADGFVDVATTTVTRPPARGSVFVDGTFGEITYTPNTDVRGSDSLTFVVSDNDGTPSNPVTIYISINNLPITIPDSAMTARNTPVTIDVLANDTDTDGTLDPSSVGSEILPDSGSIVVDTATGAITYTPNPGFSGIDTFAYFVRDNDGGFSELTSVVVRVINADAPLAMPDEIISLGRNTPVTIDVLANDSTFGVPVIPSTLTLTRLPSGGVAFVDTTGFTVRYLPNLNFVGADTLFYTVMNDSGLTSNEGVMALTVRAEVNDSAVTVRDSAVVVNVIANDEIINDFPPDPSTLAVLSSPSHGTVLSVDTVTGSISYSPDSGFNGVDSLIYKVNDNFGTTVAVATVKIFVRLRPFAVDDSAVVARNDTTMITVLDNDMVTDGAFVPTSLRIELPPANGVASVDTILGRISYVPNLDYAGPDSLQYSVADNYGVRSNTASVQILVVAADQPVAVDDSLISLGVNTPVVFEVLRNDSAGFVPLNPATLVITRSPSLGSASVDSVMGTIRYVPFLSVEGPDSLFYTVKNDSGVVSNEAALRFTIRAGVNDTGVTFADSSVTVAVVANDSVAPNYAPDPSTLTIVQNPVNGSVTSVDPALGTVTYAPAPGFTGRDSLIYAVEDGKGTPVAVATLSITVRPPNRPPTALDDQATVRQNTSALIDVLANDSDPDNDALILAAVDDPPNGAASVVDGKVFYTPDMNFVGMDSLRYVVHDGFQGRDTATVRIEVILLAYDITDLGTLGGTVSRAYGLNDSNHVVGASTDVSGKILPFLWRNDTLRLLSVPDSGPAQAIALNDSGRIAGVWQTNGRFRAVAWVNDSLMTPAGTPEEMGAAFGINAAGIVVGSASDGSGLRAFSWSVWSGGGLQFADLPGRVSEAFDVNAASGFAGYVQDQASGSRAAYGTPDSGWIRIDTSLGAARAFALNDSGYSAGSFQTSTGISPAVWNPAGAITVLPVLSGNFAELYSLNNDGIGVGVSGTVDFPASAVVRPSHPVWFSSPTGAMLLKTSMDHLRATIWIRGTPFDLNDAIPQTGEWVLLEARAINNGSAIVGTGNKNGMIRAFLLTPSSNQAPLVASLSVRVYEGSSVVFDVLQRATDPEGELLTLVAVEGQKHGSVLFDPRGEVSYTAFEGFVGNDTLTVTVADRSARTRASAVVTIVRRPEAFALYQNYPNPFNPSTTITFSLPVKQKIRLEIYDLLGRRVSEIINDVLDAGPHEVVFQPTDLSSGVYFYTLSGPNGRISRRLIFLK